MKTEQVRLLDEEIRPLTREETLRELESSKEFLQQFQERLNNYQTPDSYPMMKGYEKRQAIEELKEKIAKEEKRRTRLNETLYGFGQPVTMAELGIQVFGYPKNPIKNLTQ